MITHKIYCYIRISTDKQDYIRQKNILEDYKADIIKYAEDKEKTKIRACFDSIPNHLSQDYKKFRYSLIDKRGSSTKYAGSLEWLNDADIINFCYCSMIGDYSSVCSTF